MYIRRCLNALILIGLYRCLALSWKRLFLELLMGSSVAFRAFLAFC